MYNVLMLDDNVKVSALDASDALGVLSDQPNQLATEIPLSGDVSPGSFRQIVLAGMGGSALAGLLMRNWLDDRLKIPFIITRNYELPAFVGPETLVIASSYSGNTEETLAAYETAKKAGAKIVVVASGGEMTQRAQAAGQPVYAIPAGYQPRMAVWFSMRALAQLFDKLQLTQGAAEALGKISPVLESAVRAWRGDNPAPQNLAKQLATKLAGNATIIYAGPALAAAAYKWKINLNENGKNLAWSNEYPEANHNEIVGWTSQQDKTPFAVIELCSVFDNERVRLRFQAVTQLLEKHRPTAHKVEAEGETKLAQLLWTVLLGDFVSVYLALLNGVDPTPVDIIEDLKEALR